MENQIEMAVRENVIQQVNELRQLEAVFSRAYASGDLLNVGAVYDLQTGNIEFLDETINFPPTEYVTEDITGRYPVASLLSLVMFHSPLRLFCINIFCATRLISAEITTD